MVFGFRNGLAIFNPFIVDVTREVRQIPTRRRLAMQHYSTIATFSLADFTNGESLVLEGFDGALIGNFSAGHVGRNAYFARSSVFGSRGNFERRTTC